MLLRKILLLKSLNEGFFPYDYYYSISCQLYKKISLYNKDYSIMLHDEGLRSKDDKRKKLKLFNYSIRFHNQGMNDNGIKINENDIIELTVSGSDKIINAILQGLIIDNKFNINDINFNLIDIKDDKYVKFNKINIYKVFSPVVESIYNKEKINNKNVEFLNPYQLRYYQALQQNLNRKYELIYNKKYNGKLSLQIENILTIKRKSFSIKKGYIQGWAKFNMLVQADKDMQKVAYYCGLGQNNSFGAGFLDYITGGE